MSEIIDEGFSSNETKPLLSIQPRKQFLIIALISMLVLKALLTLLNYIQYGNYESYFAGDFSAAARSETMVAPIIITAGLYILSFILCAVAVCVWMYRANQNIHKAGLTGIEYTPGWSVGWFFVPFANLVKPANVLTEIFNGTNQLSGKYSGSAWQSQKMPTYVVIWWLFYIVSGFITNFASNLFDEQNLESNNYSLIALLNFTTLVLLMISGYFLIRLVQEISLNQEQSRTNTAFEIADIE